MSEESTKVEDVETIIEDVEKRLESVQETFNVPVQIGHRVRCRVTGYRGTVTVKVFNLYRVPQFHVQAKAIGGQVGNSIVFDEVQLEVLEEKPIFDIKIPEDFKFKLGQQVKDSVTGWNGTIVAIEFHMNQCIRYRVANKFIPGDKTSMSHATFDEGALLNVQEEKEVNKVEETKPNPSSPNRGCSMEIASDLSAY